MTGQMFRGPDAYPSDQGKDKDRVAQDAFGGAHLCRIQTQPGLDVGEKLFDGPAPGETLNEQDGFEIQVGRRQVSGLAFALAVSDDDDLKLYPGLRPPSDERFVVEAHKLAVNFDSNPLPAATGPSDRRKTGKPASVFGLASPLFSGSFGKGLSEDGVEAQTAGQRDFHRKQWFEDRLIVVGPIGHKRNLEGNPGLDFLERLDRNLESSPKLRLGTALLGPVKGDPERQSHRHAKQLDDDGQDDPIVPPDVAGPGTAGVIPKRTGAKDMFAPFGTQRIVDGDEEFLQLKGLDDQLQKGFEENLVTKLEMGEETVETGFVAFEACSVSEPADVPLAGLNQPGNCGRTKIRPASFGKGQTKVEDYFRKFRCSSVVDHGPFSWGCEFVSQQIASENGLFFLNSLSRVNL